MELPSTELLKEILSLTLEREKIIAQIAATDAKLGGFGGNHTVRKAVKVPTTKTVKKATPAKVAAVKVKIAPKGKRVNLSDSVSALLKNKPEGMSVPEIAKAIGAKPASLHVFFNTTGKKIAGFKRVARGVYAITGDTTAPKPKPTKAPVVKPVATEPVAPVEEVGSPTLTPDPVTIEPAPVAEAPVEPKAVVEPAVSQEQPEPAFIEEERVVVLDEAETPAPVQDDLTLSGDK